jgi:predicted Zn-dependent peptidase
MLDRTTPPGIKDAVEFNIELKPYRLFTLDNGVPVYAFHGGAEEVLQLELVFDAGSWYEGKDMVAGTTNFLIRNGTANRTAFEISEHFDFYGAYLNRTCYSETSNVVLHCLNKHLGELLPVLTEVLTEPVFLQQELDTYRQNMKQRLVVNEKKCDFIASRMIDVHLYGEEHPYGRYSKATTYDALQRDDLVSFHDRHYAKGHCQIFVAGLLPDDLDKQLNKAFGHLHWTKDPLARSPIEVKPSAVKRHRLSNDPDGVQGAIRIARPFPGRRHPDFHATQVLNTLFGGFFGSRLMSNIREDKGYTYGIYSFLQNHIEGSAWMVSTEAGRDVCEETVKEVYKEMRRLNDEKIEAEELLLVKNYMMGTILGDLDGPFQVIGRWKNIILNGLDEQYFYKGIQTIKQVKADELTALARKYLQPEAFYELVVV